jgi:hypothetical protein
MVMYFDETLPGSVEDVLSKAEAKVHRDEDISKEARQVMQGDAEELQREFYEKNKIRGYLLTHSIVFVLTLVPSGLAFILSLINIWDSLVSPEPFLDYSWVAVFFGSIVFGGIWIFIAWTIRRAISGRLWNKCQVLNATIEEVKVVLDAIPKAGSLNGKMVVYKYTHPRSNLVLYSLVGIGESKCEEEYFFHSLVQEYT